MMSEPADSGYYQVTCEDCNAMKTYYTHQGVSFFKFHHEGHNVKVTRGPKQEAPPVGAVAPEAEALAETTNEAPVAAPSDPTPEAAPLKREVNLKSLVVDLVNEGSHHTFKIFGVAEGKEEFSRSFDATDAQDAKNFVESGVTVDDRTGMSFKWQPSSIDVSGEARAVLLNMDQPPELGPAVEEVEQQGSEGGVVQEQMIDAPPAPTEPVAEAVPEPPKARPKRLKKSKAGMQSKAEKPMSTETLLTGRFSFIAEGTEYAEEASKVSKVLREFRWNIEPPYVIAALFDDILSVESQIGTMSAGVIEMVSELGYRFVAIEAPKGKLTAYFRKVKEGSAEPSASPEVEASTFRPSEEGARSE